MITLALIVVLFVVIAARLALAFSHALPDGLGYRDENKGNALTPAKPPTRLYMWRVHVKGMPRGFKIREVPWDLERENREREPQ